MGYTVNIDIGGTFTDLFMTGEQGQVAIAKAPTTHYDLSVGFMNGMKDLAFQSGTNLQNLLGQTDAIRYCTTLGTNALIERTGPKLGLITTAGFEDTLSIGRARSWADGIFAGENKDLARIMKPKPLIPREMIVGLKERIDSMGNVVSPLQREEVLEKLQYLVDRGAMGFVVCLLWSFINPTHEQKVKEIIEEEYPEIYLGNMPVILSSEISPKMGEYTRFTTAIVNAYIHAVMADELSKLGNELRDNGYRRPLILMQNTGGMKKLSRTKAVNTHNAGPVAGLNGSLYVGNLYGRKNVIFTDMGGTSFDIGVISGGRIQTYDFIPVIDRWRTNIPAIEVKSIGAGGGSIAWVNTLLGNRIEVGPQSAGSMPGPACYNQGGKEATVTDADLVLGYINPDNYLGGKIFLDKTLSEETIKEKIAGPLGIDVVDAAVRIKRIVDAHMGQEIFREVVLKGYDPREFVLFACGGAGPTHVCGFAPFLGIKKVIASGFAPVFGAFGASTADVMQVFEKSKTVKLFIYQTQSYLEDLESFNSVVKELKEIAVRDLRLEGFREDQIGFELELEMRYGMQYNYTKATSPHVMVRHVADVKDICDHFTKIYSEIYTPEAAFPQGGVNVECFYLKAFVSIPHYEFKPLQLKDKKPPEEARKGVRRVFWLENGGFTPTPVFSFEKINPGNEILGPAVVEADDTTCVIHPTWRYTLDQYRNGILEKM
jgi:N-methylhydantoinase A/acetophenone carboxylase